MNKKKYYYNFFSFISFFLLFFFSFLVYKYFLKSEVSIVNFYNNELSSEFEMEITNNLENLESFFENHTFIEKYLINRKNSEIDINIKIKEPTIIEIIDKILVELNISFFKSLVLPLLTSEINSG